MIPCITRRWYVNPNLNLNPKLRVKEIERPQTKHIHRINCVACYCVGMAAWAWAHPQVEVEAVSPASPSIVHTEAEAGRGNPH